MATWQVRFIDSTAINKPMGIKFLGARKNARGQWSTSVPDYVREYLNLHSAYGALYSYDFHSIKDLIQVCTRLDTVKIQRTNNETFKALISIQEPVKPTKRVKEKIPSNIPAIRSLKGLCAFFCAESPSDLNKRVYKSTDCGASISLYLLDGTAFHNGGNWDILTLESKIAGFTLQTTVEGSDSTVDSDMFYLPVTHKAVEDFITFMELESSSLWQEANGDNETEEITL